MDVTRKEKIRQALTAKIRGGEWQVGARIPSERDLALEFGVSRVTVREALQRLESEGLLERPSGRSARIVKGRGMTRTGQIGLLVPNLSSEYSGRTSESYIKSVQDAGYEVVIRMHEDDPQVLEAQIRTLQEDGISGFGLIAPRSCPDSTLALLESLGIPTVLMVRKINNLAVPQYVVDNVKVGEMAANHLISMGHRRIVCLAILDYSVGRDRLAGFRRAIETAGLTYDPRLVVDVNDYPVHSEAGGEAVRDLVNQGVSFTAIAAFDDRQAVLAQDALRRLGIDVPQDVAIIGVNNSPPAGLYTGLSTIRIDWDEIGRLAAGDLISQLHGARPSRSYIKSCKLEVLARQSCGYLVADMQ